jgi:hypothetical protein
MSKEQYEEYLASRYSPEERAVWAKLNPRQRGLVKAARQLGEPDPVFDDFEPESSLRAQSRQKKPNTGNNRKSTKDGKRAANSTNTKQKPTKPNKAAAKPAAAKSANVKGKQPANGKVAYQGKADTAKAKPAQANANSTAKAKPAQAVANNATGRTRTRTDRRRTEQPKKNRPNNTSSNKQSKTTHPDARPIKIAATVVSAAKGTYAQVVVNAAAGVGSGNPQSEPSGSG